MLDTGRNDSCCTSVEPSNHHHDMEGYLHLHTGLNDPRSLRPNHDHFQTTARVSSDPEKKSHLHKHKSHRHHDKHEHRHSSSRRHAAKEAVQSAIQIQPPTSLGDLLNKARGSKDTSPSHSRKGSVAPGQSDRNGSGQENRDTGVLILPQKPLRPQDVEKEGKRVQARERDLRTALQSLSDQSLKTSRRLDDTYYSILEKASILQQTIGSLQELSGSTKELHDNFKKDTKDLVEDVTGQFEGFDNLEAQQELVTSLEERVKVGKEKADALTKRLAQAKERVDRRAKSETQWEAAYNRRLRFFWGTLASIAAVIFALTLFHQLKPIHIAEQSQATLEFASRTKIMDAPIPDIAKEAIIGSLAITTSSRQETSVARPLLEDDERLRKFDEL